MEEESDEPVKEHAGLAWHREINRHDEKDKKILLAYEYLAGKDYITLNRKANTLYLVKITSYGIDFIESQPETLRENNA